MRAWGRQDKCKVTCYQAAHSFSGKHSWLLCGFRCLADRSSEPVCLTTVCRRKERQGIELPAPSGLLSLTDQGHPIGLEVLVSRWCRPAALVSLWGKQIPYPRAWGSMGTLRWWELECPHYQLRRPRVPGLL